MYVKNLNQSFNYNKKNPTMDIINEDGNYIAKSQVDVKNLEIFEFKVILIGDPGVGKTSILSRFVTNEFQSVYTSTIGVEFKTKDIYINNTTCASFKIWDTCGQEKFRAITRQYFKNAKGVFLVFDLTNKETIKKLNVWLRDVKENIDNEFFVFLIGNKMDVKDRDISISEEAKQFSNEKKINYYEISAKTGSGVYNIFEKMANKLVDIEKIERNKNENNNKIKNNNIGNRKFNIEDYNKDRGKIEPPSKNSRCC